MRNTFLKYLEKEFGNLDQSKLNINFEVSSLSQSSNFKILLLINKESAFVDRFILSITCIGLF